MSLLAVTRPLTTLFHELGHGIPALIFTSGTTTLYIGSLGDPDKSLVLNIGRLKIYFRYNPLLWDCGLCRYGEGANIPKKFIIVLFGPFTSLILGLASLAISYNDSFSNWVQITFFVFFISSLYDFFTNIIPKNEAVLLHDGGITYNDGHQLKKLLGYKRLEKTIVQAFQDYENKEYKKAASTFDLVLKKGGNTDTIYRYAISTQMQLKNYEEAFKIQTQFAKTGALNADDYSNSGLIKSWLGKHEESLIDYSKSIDLKPDHVYSLNNRGYTYNLLHQYEKAIEDFDKALVANPEFAYSYNNRGLAKIKLKQVEDGLRDIKRSMELDDKNAYAFRNLGIYFFDKGNYKKALENFEIAQGLDKHTHQIDELIKEAKERLAN